MKQVEDVKDQYLERIRRDQAMVRTKNTTFIVAPGFYEDDATLEEMIFTDDSINLRGAQV